MNCYCPPLLYDILVQRVIETSQKTSCLIRNPNVPKRHRHLKVIKINKSFSNNLTLEYLLHDKSSQNKYIFWRNK